MRIWSLSIVMACVPATPTQDWPTPRPAEATPRTGDAVRDDTGRSHREHAVTPAPRPFPGLLHVPRVTTLRTVVLGAHEDDRAGLSVTGVGDVDGDGLDDVALGAPRVDAYGLDIGQAYLLHGARLGFWHEAYLADHSATITGLQEDERFGARLLGLGDVDGDGRGDLLAAAPFCCPEEANRTRVGRLDLIPGDAIPATPRLSSVVRRATWYGAHKQRVGARLAHIGDMDEDGHPEVAVGLGRTGKSDQIPLVHVRVDPNPRLTGRTLWLPRQVGGPNALNALPVGAGDVDGDGRRDLLVGLPDDANDEDFRGEAWVLPGASLDALDPLTVASLGVRIVATEAHTDVGFVVSPAGDVDGDGLDDVLVGARPEEALALWDLFLVPGATLALGDTITLGDTQARLRTHPTRWHPGAGPITVGDMNGDGADDLVLGVAKGRHLESALDDVVWVDGAALAPHATVDLTGLPLEFLRVVPVGDLDADGWIDLALSDERDDLIAPDAGRVVLLAGPPYNADQGSPR